MAAPVQSPARLWHGGIGKAPRAGRPRSEVDVLHVTAVDVQILSDRES